MWGVLKNVTALAQESAQNLTSQATQLLEQLDGGMNDARPEDEDEDNDTNETEEVEPIDAIEEAPIEQVGPDGETFFVSKKPTSKRRPKAGPQTERDSSDSGASEEVSTERKERRPEEPPSRPAESQSKDAEMSTLLQEEVTGLKSLIKELTGQLDAQKSQHSLDLELQQNESKELHKEVDVLSKQLTDANKKLEKQASVMQLQANLKEIKESRDAMKNDVATTLNAFQAEFSSLVGSITPQKGSSGKGDKDPATLELDLASVRGENEHLRQQVEALSTKLSASHEVHQQLTSVVEGLKAAQEKYKDQAKAAMGAMKDKHAEEAGRAREQLGSLQAALDASHRELEALRGSLAEVRAERASDQKSFDKLRAESEEASKKAAAEALQALTDARNELQEARLRVQELETAQGSSSATMEESVRRLTLQLQEQQSAAETAQSAAQKDHEAALSALRKDLQAAKDSAAAAAAASSEGNGGSGKGGKKSPKKDTKELDALRGQLTAMTQERDAAAAEQVRASATLLEAERDSADRLAQSQKETAALAAQVTELTAQLESVQSLKAAFDAITLDSQRTAETMRHQNEVIASLTADNQTLSQKAEQSSNSRGADEQDQLAALSVDLTAAQQTIATLGEEVRAVSTKLADSDVVNEQLGAELARVQALREETLNLLQMQMEEETTNHNSMHASFLECKNALKACQAKLDAETAAHSELRQAHDSLRAANDALKTENSSESVELADLRHEHQQLTASLAALEQQLAAETRARQALSEDLATTSQLKAALEADFSSVKESLDAFSAEKSTAQALVAQLEAQTAADAAEVARLREALSAAEQSLGSGVDATAALTARVEHLSQSNETLHKQIEEAGAAQVRAGAEAVALVEQLRDELKAAVAKLAAAEQQVLETQTLKDSLVQQLQEAAAEREQQAATLSATNARVMKLQGESLIIKDEYQSKINVLEASLQDRVVETATLNERLKEVSAAAKRDGAELAQARQTIAELRAAHSEVHSESSKTLSATQAQLDAALEELRFTQEQLANAQDKQASQATKAEQLSAKLAKLSGIEKTYNEQAAQIAEYVSRAETAEESLGRVNEKKKKDLETFKKQNERLNALQREKAALEETLAELRAASEGSANSAVEGLTRRLEASQAQAEEWRAKCAGLELQVADLLNTAANSTAPTPSAEEAGRSEADAEEIRSLQSRVEELLKLVAELESRCSGFDAQIEEVVDELRATAEARDKAQKDLQVQKTELVGEALRLNGEVLQAQQESSIWEAKVTSLENEIKLLQKNISSNLDIVAPLGQRQRIERVSSMTAEVASSAAAMTVVDLETGGLASAVASSPSKADATGLASLCIESAAAGNLSEKKESGGSHAVMYFLWNQIRKYAPWLLPFVGDRPPRVTSLGLAMLAYFAVLQLVVLYLGLFRTCKR